VLIVEDDDDGRALDLLAKERIDVLITVVASLATRGR
jgi:hypothetical protein